jgi:hypothetical protein
MSTRKRRRSRLRRRYGRMTQMDLPFNRSITNVLGESRQIEKVWPGGAYTCPFCASTAEPTGCKNPACSAGEWALSSPHAARAHFEERQRQAEERKKEEVDREERSRIQKNYFEESRREATQERENVIQEANRRGACVRCALEKSYAPKFVKHRGTCPKERR